MEQRWEALLGRLFADEFGPQARSAILQRARQLSTSHYEPVRQHINVASLAFDIIALVLNEPAGHTSVSKRVTANLLQQIAQDTQAVCLLAAYGFPYQAVAVSVSSFEHAMM